MTPKLPSFPFCRRSPRTFAHSTSSVRCSPVWARLPPLAGSMRKPSCITRTVRFHTSIWPICCFGQASWMRHGRTMRRRSRSMRLTLKHTKDWVPCCPTSETAQQRAFTLKRDSKITQSHACPTADTSLRSTWCSLSRPAEETFQRLICSMTPCSRPVIVADQVAPLARLPPHQLVFNAMGDADCCEPALKAAIGLVERTKMPVINDPSAVMKTGRVANSIRLRAVPGVVTALTVPMTKQVLLSPQGPATLAREGFYFPMLLRSPGYHTGRNFVMVGTANELAAVAASLPGEQLLAIEFLDACRSDGTSRKYRVMMIDGQLYPLHLAISRDWKVHYFTSEMSEKAD